MRGADEPEILVLQPDATARTRDARHLLHHAQRVLDVQDHRDGEDDVEAAVAERQPVTVGATEGDASAGRAA